MNKNCRELPAPGFVLMAITALLGCQALIAAAAPQGTADLLTQAKAYEDKQNYPAAEDLYRRMLASDPGNPELLKQLGILEQTDMKLGDSIEHFKRLLARQPEYPQVNFFLGLSYFAQHNYKDAMASFQSEAKTPTAHPATQYYIALCLEGEDRPTEAIVQLEQVAARNPQKANVFYELARLYISASFRAIDQLHKIDADSFQFHALMGELYSQEAYYDAAIAQYQDALKKQPDALGIHSRLGVDYWKSNQAELAERELRLAVQEAPDDPLANLYLGNIALRQRDFSKALPYLERASALRPKDVETRILLGRCYLGLGKLQEAKSDLLAAVGLDSDDPRSHYMLAEVYQKLNQPADRERELELFNKLSAQKNSGAADDPSRFDSPGGKH